MAWWDIYRWGKAAGQAGRQAAMLWLVSDSSSGAAAPQGLDGPPCDLHACNQGALACSSADGRAWLPAGSPRSASGSQPGTSVGRTQRRWSASLVSRWGWREGHTCLSCCAALALCPIKGVGAQVWCQGGGGGKDTAVCRAALRSRCAPTMEMERKCGVKVGREGRTLLCGVLRLCCVALCLLCPVTCAGAVAGNDVWCAVCARTFQA